MKSSSFVRSGVISALLLGSLSLQAAEPKFIVADPSPARTQLPFSDAVKVGDTLYVAGTLGIDLGTSQAPSDPKLEAKLVMDAVQHTLQAAGYKMEDMVYVQIFCTDIGLYAGFNEIYRSYFHDHFPARAFIGASALVRGAHFEVMGTAIKR